VTLNVNSNSRNKIEIIGMKVLISEGGLLNSGNYFYSTFDKNGQINGVELQKWNFKDRLKVPMENKNSEDFMLKSDIVNVDFDRIFSKKRLEELQGPDYIVV